MVLGPEYSMSPAWPVLMWTWALGRAGINYFTKWAGSAWHENIKSTSLNEMGRPNPTHLTALLSALRLGQGFEQFKLRWLGGKVRRSVGGLANLDWHNNFWTECNLEGIFPCGCSKWCPYSHNASGSFSDHAPLALSNYRFITFLMILFMASTWPFDWGWASEAKNRLILRQLQNCLKRFESNCLPLSVIIAYGIPNR